MIRGLAVWGAVGLLAVSCTQSVPMHQTSDQTKRGVIRYTLHSPDPPARGHLILAHGFLRNPQTMHHLAEELADQGIATACIALKRSRPWAGNHKENARDMIALRQALGWNQVAYAGFSSGGLSALLAAAEDPACESLLLLDPVDHASLGEQAAPRISIPTLAILGKPGPGNAWRNSRSMLAAIPEIQIVEIPTAGHADFEAVPCAIFPRVHRSRAPATRTAAIHQQIQWHANSFLFDQQ